MSPDLEKLIGRAVVDQKFREGLLADSEASIKNAGLSLTKDEIKEVRANLTGFKAHTDSNRLGELLEPEDARAW